MRGAKRIVMLVGGLTMSGAAGAGETPQGMAAPVVAYLHGEDPAAADWRVAAEPDRLDYLSAPAGCRRGHPCAGAAAAGRLPPAPVKRDYVDALDLVSYGPVDVKFTGDRVKLKVRF